MSLSLFMHPIMRKKQSPELSAMVELESNLLSFLCRNRRPLFGSDNNNNNNNTLMQVTVTLFSHSSHYHRLYGSTALRKGDHIPNFERPYRLRLLE